LKGVALDSIVGYPVVGQRVLVLDLTKGIQPDQGPWGNFSERIILKGAPCWVFWAQGTLYQALNFAEAGKYTVKVKAAGIAAENIWPIMKVYVGPKYIGSAEIISQKGEYNEYTFNVDIPAEFGVQDFMITYQNSAKGGARNLFIKGVLFEPTKE
ncbi:MAG: carbohydrate-binding domain-containing protein, partial [Desulfoprunum sp.]|nr:carbohydrate-binding domain-containing protein [Desulfoprunum sp.]